MSTIFFEDEKSIIFLNFSAYTKNSENRHALAIFAFVKNFYFWRIKYGKRSIGTVIS